MSIDLPDSIVTNAIDNLINEIHGLLEGVDFSVLPKIQYTLDALGAQSDENFYGIQDDIASLIIDIESGSDTAIGVIETELDALTLQQDQWFLDILDTVNEGISATQNAVADEIRNAYQRVEDEINDNLGILGDSLGFALANLPDLFWGSFIEVLDPMNLVGSIGDMIYQGVKKFTDISEDTVVDIMKMFVNMQKRLQEEIVI